MDVEEQFQQLLNLVESLKSTCTSLQVENVELKSQIKELLGETDDYELESSSSSGTGTGTGLGGGGGGNKRRSRTIDRIDNNTKNNIRSSTTLSNIAMMDVVKFAQDSTELTRKSTALVQLEEEDEEEHGYEGMESPSIKLIKTIALDPTESSYTTGYDYSLLSAKEVLITLHDVGVANKYIDNGPGMWVNYILTKERNTTLKLIGKKDLLKSSKEGQYYHIKSLRDGLRIDELITFCQNKGIKAIVPSSVQDEIYCARNKTKLNKQNIWPCCCDDPISYETLDHKWLSYQFCQNNDIAMSETLPLRVDTEKACRELVEKTIQDGKPCFIKECFDTCAGDGVIKVSKVDEYDDAIDRITQGKGPQRSDTGGLDQHIIIQAGHPGRICCAHSIFYKGHMISCYVTKENTDIMDKLGDLKLEMAIGTWSPNKEDLSTSFKLDLNDPADRTVRDQAVSILTKVGQVLNYTGMLEVEFIIAENEGPDAVLHVLEFNPRFSGACHAYVGSGMVQDYMHLLGLIASTQDDTDLIRKTLATTHIRSDTHIPQSNFKDYNAVKFYSKLPLSILKLRNLSK